MYATRPKQNEDSVRTLYQEARRRAKEEGVATYDEWRDLIRDLIQERVNEGAMDTGEDTLTAERDLEILWSDVERSLR
jgi:hypothetical protein